MTSEEQCTRISQQFLDKAREALEEGDVLQASDKSWGAAAQAVKSIAQRRGWPHDGHRLLFNAITRLAEETGDRELGNLFHVSNSLHSDFYENWMTQEFVEQGLDQVMKLVDRLERIA